MLPSPMTKGEIRDKAAGVLIALALAGCGSQADPPSGPDAKGGDGPVTLAFADSALQAAVHESGAGAEIVSLIAEDRGIADLGGIEQFTRLEALDLSHNEITDISPLAGLQRLRFLDLEGNRIEDVSALASLKRLQVLLLGDNDVRDVSALAGLDSLQNLGLTGNPLSGTETTELLDGLRERGVTVDFEAPGEPGAGDDDVDSVPPLKETQLLFSSTRGTGFEAHPELFSLDLETGDVVELSALLALAPLADGSLPETVTVQLSDGRQPARSPDGSRVAFASYRDRNNEIYVMRADGSRPENLTLHEAWDGDPCWSPDGRRIAFTSDRHGEREVGPPGSGHYNSDIFILNADGTGVQQLTFDSVEAYDPAWSPDGLSIAFTSDRDVPNGPAAIYVVDLASGVDRRLSGSDHYAWDPSWSPDGAWIAFGQQSNRTSHVWVMAADGSGARQLTFAEAWARNPTWSPDGTRIAFGLEDRDEEVGFDIYIVSVEDGAVERITEHPGEDRHPNWTPF